MDATTKSDFLILVHPGSACGSADFNLGSEDAAFSRSRLISDLDAWSGPIAVIDGRLSRELAQRAYYALGTAVGNAIARAARQGLFAEHFKGEDGTARDQVWAMLRIIERANLTPQTHRVELTGAWYNDNGISGCVNDVRRALEKRGFDVAVRSSAINELGPNPESGTDIPPEAVS